MTGPVHKYCIDTSSLIEAWGFRYPNDAFPSLWVKFDELVKARRIVAPEEVHQELKKKDDDLFKWCDWRKDQLFVPLDNLQQLHVKQILRQFPRLVDTTKGRSMADPFVIALADLRGYTVISEEMSKKTAPKIPDVCVEVGVKCIKFLALIRQESWCF